MKRPSLLVALSIVLLVSLAGYSQTVRPPDRVMLVQIAQTLEEQPFNEKAKDLRAWAVTYVIQTDAVSVVVCGGKLVEPLLDKKNKYGSELTAQYTIGMAAFKLKNPDKANDENAAQFAGLESAIKTYLAIVKEKPKAQFAAMDDLAVKLQSGELKKLVDEANCGKGTTKPTE